MRDHSLLGSCGAFLRSVASHWSGDGRLHVELPETAAFLSAGMNKAGTSDAIKKAEG